MFGNGTNKTISQTTDSKAYIMKTEQFTFTGASSTSTSTPAGWNPKFEGPDGKNYTKINPKFYTESGASTSSFNTGEKYFCTYDLDTTGSSVVEISANSFPGTYYVTGDTYARSEASGKDELNRNSSLAA